LKDEHIAAMARFDRDGSVALADGFQGVPAPMPALFQPRRARV
jgi:hypothetical protein